MGLGMLRRYHARPDAGVERATGHTTPAPPVTGEQDTAEVVLARAEWEAAAADAAAKTSALSELKESLDLENLSEEDQARLADAESEAQAATEAEESAKIAFEEAEAASGKFEGEAGEETLEQRTERATAAGLTRNSSKDNWLAFAGEGFKDQTRDEIAVHFLGPKS